MGISDGGEGTSLSTMKPYEIRVLTIGTLDMSESLYFLKGKLRGFGF